MENEERLQELGILEEMNRAASSSGNTFLSEGISLKWIFTHLKVLSPGLILFLIGFNGMYFLPLIIPQSLYQDAQPATYRYYVFSWLLVCAGGIWEMFAGKFRLIRLKPFWAYLMVFSIVVMTIQGLFDKELVVSIFAKASPFLWLFFVPEIGMQERNWPWLWLTFLVHIPVSVLFSFYTFFVQNATTRVSIIFLVGENFLMQTVYISPFLFLMLPALRDRFLKSVAIFMLGLFVLLSLFFNSRTNTILLPIMILMVLYIYFRSRRKQESNRVSLTWLIPMAVIIGLFWLIAQPRSSQSQTSSIFINAYSGLEERFTSYGTVVNTLVEDVRSYESRIIIASMSISDWIIGKGLGASWSDVGFANGELRYMVHNTWLNAFYWGGVFLFLAITIPLFWVIWILLQSRDIVTLGCAAYALLIYITFPSFLRTYVSLDWALFCVTLGVFVLNDVRHKRLT